jgi:hypothetical protein
MRSGLESFAVRMALFLAVVCALSTQAERAAAQDVRLYVAPGVAAPLSRFIDNYPLIIDPEGPSNCGEVETGTAFLERRSVDSDVGFNLSLGALIGNAEISYSMSRHQWGRVELTGVAFCFGNNHPLNDAFFDPETVSILLDTPVPRTIAVDADDEGLEALFIHRLLFGYRFYVLDGAIRPYIPVALGATVINSADLEAVFGGSAQIGVGVEVEFTNGFSLGLDARYMADIVQNPALKGSSVSRLGSQAAIGGDSLFESVIEVFQSFVISASVAYRL